MIAPTAMALRTGFRSFETTGLEGSVATASLRIGVAWRPSRHFELGGTVTWNRPQTEYSEEPNLLGVVVNLRILFSLAANAEMFVGSEVGPTLLFYGEQTPGGLAVGIDLGWRIWWDDWALLLSAGTGLLFGNDLPAFPRSPVGGTIGEMARFRIGFAHRW
jgi:hypothetical protein